VSVTVCAAEIVFATTLPKDRLVALKVRVGTLVVRLKTYVAEALLAVAVSVADCAVVTGVTVAVNAAMVDPAGTVTELGSATAELLLASDTAWPPLGAAVLSVTVQLSDVDPETVPLAQETALTVDDVPVPLNAITSVPFVLELLVIVSFPVLNPVPRGRKLMVSVAVWPGVNVKGNVAPVALKFPEEVSALIVIGAVPEEVSVTVCVEVVFTMTVPNVRLAVLKVSVGVPVPNCNTVVPETLSAVAVSVTDWAAVTAATEAVNVAVVAPAATVTEEGTVTAVLLLDSPTHSPPVGAAGVTVTVHVSESAVVGAVLLHETAGGVAAASRPRGKQNTISNGRPMPQARRPAIRCLPVRTSEHKGEGSFTLTNWFPVDFFMPNSPTVSEAEMLPDRGFAYRSASVSTLQELASAGQVSCRSLNA